MSPQELLKQHYRELLADYVGPFNGPTILSMLKLELAKHGFEGALRSRDDFDQLTPEACAYAEEILPKLLISPTLD